MVLSISLQGLSDLEVCDFMGISEQSLKCLWSMYWNTGCVVAFAASVSQRQPAISPALPTLLYPGPTLPDSDNTSALSLMPFDLVPAWTSCKRPQASQFTVNVPPYVPTLNDDHDDILNLKKAKTNGPRSWSIYLREAFWCQDHGHWWCRWCTWRISQQDRSNCWYQGIFQDSLMCQVNQNCIWAVICAHEYPPFFFDSLLHWDPR